MIPTIYKSMFLQLDTTTYTNSNTCYFRKYIKLKDKYTKGAIVSERIARTMFLESDSTKDIILKYYPELFI